MNTYTVFFIINNRRNVMGRNLELSKALNVMSKKRKEMPNVMFGMEEEVKESETLHSIDNQADAV